MIDRDAFYFRTHLCIGQRKLLPSGTSTGTGTVAVTGIARTRRLVSHRSEHLDVVARSKSSLWPR